MEKKEMVEIVEHYSNGVLVSLKANGVELPLPPHEWTKEAVDEALKEVLPG